MIAPLPSANARLTQQNCKDAIRQRALTPTPRSSRQRFAEMLGACAIALCSLSALAAQEAPELLDLGVWSGELTPMHHPDAQTPLRLAVSRPAGSLVIEIRGPDDLALPTQDVTASEAGVVFSFFEPEADVLLRCDLRFGEGGALRGRCTDPSGKWASLTMRPPHPGP